MFPALSKKQALAGSKRRPIVEPIGAETYFYLQTGAHTVISRSNTQVSHREAGHRMLFQINVAKVHLFNPETTERIE